MKRTKVNFLNFENNVQFRFYFVFYLPCSTRRCVVMYLSDEMSSITAVEEETAGVPSWEELWKGRNDGVAGLLL